MRSICVFVPAIVVIVVFAAVPASAAQPEGPARGDYDEVKRVIEFAIGWAVEKDFDKMFSIWAHDENLYHHWLTSTSTTRGFAEFEAHAAAWRDPKFKGTTYEFRDLEITFSRSGEVAWYSCRLDDCYVFDGKSGCIENVHQTGVLEKRDGIWVHVLMHGSYPVDEIPIEVVKRRYGDALAETAGESD